MASPDSVNIGAGAESRFPTSWAFSRRLVLLLFIGNVALWGAIIGGAVLLERMGFGLR